MTQLHAITAWLADKDGFYSGEISSPSSPDDFATFAANAAKNGQTAIDATAPGAKRPPDRPAPPPPPDLKAAYAGAITTDAKLDVIAQRLALK